MMTQLVSKVVYEDQRLSSASIVHLLASLVSSCAPALTHISAIQKVALIASMWGRTVAN